MKKVLCVAALCVAVLALPAEVWGADASARWEAFAESLSDLAQKIITHNKLVFETKFTRQERSDALEGPDMPDPRSLHERGLANEILDRVWAKDKTLVMGAAERDKRFYAYYMETRDPDLVFLGGIRVGADIDVLEKAIGMPLRQQDEKSIIVIKPGEISLNLETTFGNYIQVRHKNKKITEIEWIFSDSSRPSSQKTVTFVNKKKAEMGLSASMTMLPDPASRFDGLSKFDGFTKGYLPAQIRGMRVNLRSGPSTKSKVITQLNEGEPIQVYGTSHESDGRWHRVRTSKGKEGWVFGKYVQ